MMGVGISFFDINNIFFTIFSYPMSYLEFFGTILNLASVYLVTRNNVLTWPIGNIAVILFAVLFYKIRLYSDFVEQIYFFLTGFYGWWAWLYFKKEKAVLPITTSSVKIVSVCLTTIFVCSLLTGYLMQHIHEFLPRFFPEPASFPYLDAFTTIMSFVATILMAHKKIECWYLWILVDIIGVWLYFQKGVIFVSVLYAIFLILATKGLINWHKLKFSSSGQLA